MTTTPGFPHSARPTGGRRKQRTTVMRTRRNLVTGIAAAALALTACGMAAGCSGGTPAGHAAAASAGHAPAGTWVTGQGTSPRSSSTSCGAGTPPGRSGRRRARQRLRISGFWPRSSGMWCCTPGSRPGAGKTPARCRSRHGRQGGPAGGRVPGAGRPTAIPIDGFSAGDVGPRGWRAGRGPARLVASSAGPQTVAAPCAGWSRRRRAPRPAAAPPPSR